VFITHIVTLEIAEALLAGQKLTDFAAQLPSNIFRLAKNILNRFNLRNKWTPFDYELLGEQLSHSSEHNRKSHAKLDQKQSQAPHISSR